MTLRGVIFDLGGTLVHYHPDIENAGADAVHSLLSERGYALPAREEARARSLAVLEQHWHDLKRGAPMASLDAHTFLAEVGAAWGLPADALNGDLLSAAMGVYYEHMSRLLQPLPGAQEALAALRGRGLRVGVVSNTLWPGEWLMGTLAQWGLDAYLECALFSADEGVWKPDAELFHRALRALALEPEETAYVGDSLFYDVRGAQGAGMMGVLVGEADWMRSTEAGLDITPDAHVERLADLPQALAPWL